MDTKFKDKYRIETTRLQGWGYGAQGVYFVTICTKDRTNYFGEIAESLETQGVACLQSTLIGDVAAKNWLQIPEYFPFVRLGEFIIMPNHIYGVIQINKLDKLGWEINTFGPQSQNLASIIRGYKASVKTFATTNQIEFAWQPRYYDRVVRDEKELINVSQYIIDNPERWLINGDDKKDDYL